MLDRRGERGVDRELAGVGNLRPVVDEIGLAVGSGEADDVAAVVDGVGGPGGADGVRRADLRHIRQLLAEALRSDGCAGDGNGAARGGHALALRRGRGIERRRADLEAACAEVEVSRRQGEVYRGVGGKLDRNAVAETGADGAQIDAGSKLVGLHLGGLVVDVARLRVGHDHVAGPLCVQIRVRKSNHGFFLLVISLLLRCPDRP